MITMIIINSMIAGQCWSYVCRKSKMFGNSLECTSCSTKMVTISESQKILYYFLILVDTFFRILITFGWGCKSWIQLDEELVLQVVWISWFSLDTSLSRKYSANTTIPRRAVTLHLDTRASKRNLRGETIVEKPRALAPLIPALLLGQPGRVCSIMIGVLSQ